MTTNYIGILSNAMSFSSNLIYRGFMNMEDKDLLKKQVGFKIKQLRVIKQLTRQYVADKLDISLANYGCMERGEIDISITRLAELAEVFEISLSELFGESEKHIFNFIGGTGNNNKKFHNWQVSFSQNEEKELKHQLEKSILVQQSQEKEIGYLKEENTQLKEMIKLFKRKE